MDSFLLFSFWNEITASLVLWLHHSYNCIFKSSFSPFTQISDTSVVTSTPQTQWNVANSFCTWNGLFTSWRHSILLWRLWLLQRTEGRERQKRPATAHLGASQSNKPLTVADLEPVRTHVYLTFQLAFTDSSIQRRDTRLRSSASWSRNELASSKSEAATRTRVSAGARRPKTASVVNFSDKVCVPIV